VKNEGLAPNAVERILTLGPFPPLGEPVPEQVLTYVPVWLGGCGHLEERDSSAQSPQQVCAPSLSAKTKNNKTSARPNKSATCFINKTSPRPLHATFGCHTDRTVFCEPFCHLWRTTFCCLKSRTLSGWIGGGIENS